MRLSTKFFAGDTIQAIPSRDAALARAAHDRHCGDFVRRPKSARVGLRSGRFSYAALIISGKVTAIDPPRYCRTTICCRFRPEAVRFGPHHVSWPRTECPVHPARRSFCPPTGSRNHRIRNQRALLIIEHRRLQSAAWAEFHTARKSLEKATRDLHRHEEIDCPYFESWLHRTFPLLVTQLREF